MFLIRKLSHNQLRYLLLPFLALALVHFVAYKKLPFEPDYQFPLVSFLAILFICLACCEANTFVYDKLKQRWSLLSHPVPTILKQLSISLALTTVIFGILVYTSNYLLFGYIAPVSQFLSSLFVALLIISIETLIYFVRDFKRAQNTSSTVSTLPACWHYRSGNKTYRTEIGDIAYVYSQSGLVYIVTKIGEKHLTHFSSFNELGSENNTSALFRLNRQFMISAQAVSSVEKDINQKLKVSLHPPCNSLPSEAIVSRYTSPDFKKWIKEV